MFALAARTEVGEACLLSLGSDSNRRSAAGTGPPAPSVNGVTLTGNRRHEVAPHQVAGSQVEAAEPLVIKLVGWRPGIEPQPPERLALIDVADAGADALLQQQLSQRRRFRTPGAADHLIEVEGIDQDIGAEVGDRSSGIDHQLHDRRREADRHHLIEGEHGGGASLGLAPALARPVEMPRSGHPHM